MSGVSIFLSSPPPPPPPPPDIQSAAQASLDTLEQQIYSMSSFSGVHRESDAFTCQLVNCHAVVNDSEELCTRVNTVPAYLDINRMVSCKRAINFAKIEMIIISGLYANLHSMPPCSILYWEFQTCYSPPVCAYLSLQHFFHNKKISSYLCIFYTFSMQIPSHLATFSVTTTPTSAEPSGSRIKVQ